MALLIMGCGVLVQNLMLTLVSQGNKLSILDECGNPDDHIISDTRVTVFVATGNLMDDLQNCDIDNVSVFWLYPKEITRMLWPLRLLPICLTCLM